MNDRDPLHDRYLYLSVIGFAWLGGLLLARLRATLTPAPLKWTLVAANLYVLTLAFASAAQSFIWTDDLSLFRRAIEIAPDNPNSHIDYASILMKRGRCQDAIAEFSSGIALNPSWTNLNIALCYMRMGDTQKAESTFSGILKFDPRNADAYHGIGLTRLAQNDPVTAEARFRTALQLQPAGWAYHLSLGLALKQQGKIEEARKEFEAEVHSNSNSANAQQARDELGRLPLPGPPSAIVK